MKYLLLMFMLLCLSGCTPKGEDNIYLLENGYTGKVIILYDQKMGDEKEYEGNKRLYRIPASGLLKTQFSINRGYRSFPEVYYHQNGKRTQIPVVADMSEESMNKVVATLATTGKSYDLNNNVEFEYSIFYVGTNEQIRKSSEEVAKLDLRHLIKE